MRLIEAAPTAGRGELAAAKIISDELSGSGIDSTIDNWDKNRANLIAWIKSDGCRNALLFACHLDVVEPGEQGWENPPFRAIERNGKIYGRGSADMKGGIAAVVTAIRQLVDSKVELKGDIILVAAAGEETDSCGAKRFVSDFGGRLPGLCGVVIPEPTDFEVVTAHRGILWLEVKTHGRAAHGSTPQLGINAIASMRALLDKLENYRVKVRPHKLLGGCSVSVNTIAGGGAINVVPDECSVGIDVRTLPGQSHQGIIDDFREIFEGLKREKPEFEASVSIIREIDALETDGKCRFVKDLCNTVGAAETKAVGFTTDGPHFAAFGAPAVVFGPGRPEVCHKPNEYIDIADVEKAVECYKGIILKFLT